MKNGQHNITDELLVKYLLGETSDTDAQQVQLWISSSAENKKHYADLHLLWDSSRHIGAKSTIDTTDAWERFQKRTQNKTISITPDKQYKWLKIAALALLLVGCGTMLFMNRKDSQVAVKTDRVSTSTSKTIASDNNAETIKNEPIKIKEESQKPGKEQQVAQVETHQNRTKSSAFKKAIVTNYRKPASEDRAKTKGIICNNTPVSIEICITQTIKCNGRPSTVSSCSTLEPDESGRLHYKTHDKLGKHCTMSVDEITIKTISTGETIVLNAHSKPSTAQDFFKYITGQKKGGIVAGVFPDDCDASSLGNCGLKFDNNFGDLILQ